MQGADYPYFVPSILDRLYDEDKGDRDAPYFPHDQTVEQAKAVIIRDLEALFNTQQTWLQQEQPKGERLRFLMMYGLPDLTRFHHDANAICHVLEQAIACSEPRLQDVRVTPAARPQHETALCFCVEATLLLQKKPAQTQSVSGEPVTLQATFTLNPQQSVVRGAN
jgi:type VI secretion system lysozyme-like protein